MTADVSAPYRPATFPISVKGVVGPDQRVLLLKNERDEWELPGGKLDPEESPEACVVREIQEESGWDVGVGPLLDAWVYRIRPGTDVFIVTYGCHLLTDGKAVLSDEHLDVGLFTIDELPPLRMPAGYRRSCERWLRRTE